MNEKLYEEVGRNFRFFLSWRHACFAGYLVILWVIMKFSIECYKDAQSFLWLILLLGAGLGIVFAFMDKRTKKFFYAAIEVGRRLESECKLEGYFTAHARFLADRNTHSEVLKWFYYGSAIVLVVLSFFAFWLACSHYFCLMSQRVG